MANREGNVDLREAQVSAPIYIFGLAWVDKKPSLLAPLKFFADGCSDREIEDARVRLAVTEAVLGCCDERRRTEQRKCPVIWVFPQSS